MNEPRNERPYPLGAQQLQAWINQVAPYLKSLAPNQLVTVGEDGFYQTANCQSNQCAPSLGLTPHPAWSPILRAEPTTCMQPTVALPSGVGDNLPEW